MDKPGFFELARASGEDLIIHNELLHPKLYAFGASLAIALVAGILSFAAVTLDETVGSWLMGALMLVWLASTIYFVLKADLCIVEMVRGIAKGGINHAVCDESSRDGIITYLLAQVPVNAVKILIIALLGFAIASSSLPPAGASPWVDMGIQAVSVLIEVGFLVLFVFLAQIVMFDRMGAKETIARSISLGMQNLGWVPLYAVFRSLLDFVLQMVVALPLAVIIFMTNPGFQPTDIESLLTTGGLVFGVVALVQIIVRLVIDTFLVVMDTHVYSSFVPATKQKKNADKPKKKRA